MRTPAGAAVTSNAAAPSASGAEFKHVDRLGHHPGLQIRLGRQGVVEHGIGLPRALAWALTLKPAKSFELGLVVWCM